MKNEIIIKYKEEILLQENMTERDKAIWNDGYYKGAGDKIGTLQKLCMLCVLALFLALYFFVLS